MPNAEHLHFTNWKKQTPEVFYKNAVLPLNWLYEVTVWNFVSGSHLKSSRLGNITKIPVTFKPKPKFVAYAVYILSHYAFLWTSVLYVHH